VRLKTVPQNFQIRMMEHPAHGGARFSDSKYVTGDDAPAQFKWSVMRANLVAKDAPHARLEYINPAMADGHASRTLAAYAERLLAGASSPRRQETCNNIYHCHSGSGRTIVEGRTAGDEDTVLEWTEGDTFALPSWYAFHHEAKTESFLFNYNDFSALEKLGFYNDASTYMRP
jgi:gentisate 1,2-dioxygenase